MRRRCMHMICNISLPILILICAAITSGCSTSLPVKDLPAQRPLGKGLSTFQAGRSLPRSPESMTVFEAPKGPMTLRGAWAAALMHNPELAAFSWEVRAAEARTLQASLRPNPEIGVVVENIGGSGSFEGAEEAETTLGMRYLLELGGKRQKRTDLAELETEMAGWDYEMRRIEVLTEVELRFIEVLVAQRHLELARNNTDLSARVLDVVDKRIKSGAISPIEHDKQRVETISARVALERAQRNLTVVRHRLAATWGSRDPQFKSVSGALESIQPIPPIQALADLVSQNPDIARWAAEIAKRRAAVKLAESQAIPDLTTGVGVRHFKQSNDTALVLEISLPIPIFNRNQGNVLAAQFESAKAIQEQKKTEVRVQTALTGAYEEMAASYAEAVALRDEALPAAQRSFDRTQEGFKRGQFDYLDVLEVQRTLFRIRGQYVDALSTYHSAVAQVEGLIGQSIEALDGTPSKSMKPGDAPDA